MILCTVLILLNLLSLHEASPINTTKPIYGLDVVGCGFHIANLTSKTCLIDITSRPMIATWMDPLNHSLIYTIPNGFSVYDKPDSLQIQQTVLIRTIYDFWLKSIYVTVDDDDGFLGFGAEHRETEIGHFYENFYNFTYYLAFTLRRIMWYKLSVATFPSPKFTSTFEQALAKLPSTFNATDEPSTTLFKQFFDAYGTHIVVSADMGGLVWAEDWFESCLLKIHRESWIKEQVEKRYDPFGIFTKEDQTEDTTITQDETFTNHSTNQIRLVGGTESIPVEKWKEWIHSVKLGPRPINYQLRPLYTLLPAGSLRRQILKQATSYFRKTDDTQSSEYISQLQQIPKPPSSLCPTPVTPPSPSPPRSVQRQKRTVQSASSSTVNLCPFIGYKGLFCPFPNGRTGGVTSNGPNRLPSGVGMSMDLSTGQLKFPALNLTYNSSNKTWTDPYSNRTYLLPTELDIMMPEKSEGVPSVQIFHSESEMMAVWTRQLESGTWLGGEYAEIKNVSFIRNQFFNETEGTAISHYPFPLYTVSVRKFMLLPEAQSALNVLTTTYHEELYDDFIDVYGTHVITSSLIGGLYEQQTQFKRCLLQYPYVLSTMTNAQLLELLTLEATLQPLKNDSLTAHYRQRRKIILKHRLGGNPENNNLSSWKATISSNPIILKILKLQPWYDFASDPTVQTHLKNAITKRLNTSSINRQQEIAQQAAQRLGTRTVKIWAMDSKGQVFQNATNPVTLHPASSKSS